MNNIISSQAVRAWIYRVLIAAQPLVVLYGVTSSEQAALWFGVVSAALGFGLAAANTSTAPDLGDQ